MDISKLRYLQILGAPESLGFIKTEYSLLGLHFYSVFSVMQGKSERQILLILYAIIE